MKYYRPFRLLLLRISDFTPQWLTDKIMDYLYPDDAEIEFRQFGGHREQ